ncbi:NAD(P)H-hydrate dehydratase [Erysipelotrichaceae bacterium RD49]|nr:NAD(P)H-hydrate dehydratase [Erysipelotrichaceae bacterium RD49]
MVQNTFLCSAKAARTADSFAIQTLQIPSLVLMENAANAVARAVLELPDVKRIQIVCGPGNNGADGLAAARILAGSDSKKVQIYLDENKLSQDEAHQLAICKALKLSVAPLDAFSPNADLIIDALFGNGLNRPLRQEYSTLVALINASRIPVLSIDIASGLDATTGKILGAAIKAQWTIALDCLKWGHLLAEGKNQSGKITVADIGIPAAAHANGDCLALLDASKAASLLPDRSPYGNKGTFGKVLLIGGSFQMQGALSMAAQSCFHAGCGTMTLFTPVPAAKAIASKMDLAMIFPAAADEKGFFDRSAADQLSEVIGKYQTLAIGNGMGTGDGALAVLKTAIAAKLPMVIDADAINLLAKNLQLLDQIERPAILTPHLKEFSRLINRPLADVLADPFTLAAGFCKAHPNLTLVLKSDFTIIMNAWRSMVVWRPDPALAKGGSGDVLCGLISGLYAQKKDAFAMAALGVYIHNAAAKNRVSEFTFTPLDLIANYPEVFCALEKAKGRKTEFKAFQPFQAP